MKQLKTKRTTTTQGEAEAIHYGLCRNLTVYHLASILDLPVDLVRKVEASYTHLKKRTKYVEMVMAECQEIRDEVEEENRKKYANLGGKK